MTKYIVSFLFLISVSGARAGVRTVDHVELGKFIGTWYEVARNPIIFEPNCACARQVLTAVSPASVAVYNSCNQDHVGGKLREIRGTASPTDATGSKLGVDFGFIWKGDYWVVGLDKDYRYAVVTDRFGYSLYILSRTPQLAPELYQQAVSIAATQVSTKRLVPTDQLNCRYP